MAFRLSLRQEVIYRHSADIFSMEQTSDVETKRRAAKSYTRTGEAVPCHFEHRQSVNTASPFGRVEGDIQGTRDVLHLPEDVAVDADDVVVNKSLDFDGNPVQDYGRIYIVQGRPRSIPKEGNRDAGKRFVEMGQVHQAPRGVVVD